MPVRPLRFEPLVKHGRYPHMARRDLVVWERWLDKRGRAFDAVAYDVALGGVTTQFPTATEKERLGFQYVTALKIDALLLQGNALTIAEVKPEANVSALGACLAYRVHLARELTDPGPIALLVVAEFASLDIIDAATALGIAVETA